MRTRVVAMFGLFAAPGLCLADDLLYRYEGDVLPYDPSGGWMVFDPCSPPCGESLEDGRFVLRWTEPGDAANYAYVITEPPNAQPPSLWVEWRFRSNQPIPQYYYYPCDAAFEVRYGNISDTVLMHGDAAVSFNLSGSELVWALPNDEFHTYRFESPDGINYWLSIDGLVFGQPYSGDWADLSYIQFAGVGACGDDGIPTRVNEWDFVRFGTMDSGERLIVSDPPGGFVDARQFAPLDRFTITFDAPNYVYLDDISVATTAGVPPVITHTRRLEDGAPETVEIVLDRPIPFGATTRFQFDDGTVANTVEYTFAPGDTDGDGDADLRDAAQFQCCFGQAAPTGVCAALDTNSDGVIDLNDYAAWLDGANQR